MAEVTFTSEPKGPASPEQIANTEAGLENTADLTQTGTFAGKFKTVEELEQAYVEMSKNAKPADGADENKEGESDDAGSSNDDTNDNATDDDITTYGPAVAGAMQQAGLSSAELVTEFESNDGELSEESYAAFEKAGFPRDVVRSYLNGVKAQNGETADIVDAEVNAIMKLAGGEAEYTNMLRWMATSLPKAEQEAFDSAVMSGNVAAAKFAVETMAGRFVRANGSEGKSLAGRSVGGDVSAGYTHKDQMMADMSDPRYHKDQSFRDSVALKIKNSTFMK